MTAYFITGSGTDAGKTFTACALLHAAKGQGIAARGLKPVISGWQPESDSDTSALLEAMGGGAVEDISPWRFEAPLSPHRAAALEGRSLDLAEITEWSRAAASGLTLLEGVGGVMAPLTNDQTVLDWMRALGWPVIFVTGSYLGSISHTLTGLEVIRAAGLGVAALVMNESAGSSVRFDEAQAGLAPFIQNIPLRIFQPRVSSWREAVEIHTLAHAISE